MRTGDVATAAARPSQIAKRLCQFPIRLCPEAIPPVTATSARASDPPTTSSATFAHPVDLSVWHRLQAFGIFRASVSPGVTKWKVWLRTFTSAIVCSIFGMWQATHSLPGAARLVMRVLPRSCRVRAVRRFGPWQSRHISLPGLTQHRRRWPCRARSWQLKQVTPRAYIRLCTKSLPCMRFLCAVPSGKCVNVVSPSLCSSSFQ